LIELRDVWFKYEGTEDYALKGISLEIHDGEFVLLVGPSGAGKSTLLRTLNGLIPHFYSGEMKGAVLVDGVDTRDVPVSELARRVGLVFQNPENQLVTLSVEREIAFGLENTGISREAIREAILRTATELGIEELLDKPIPQLSGGQKQIVAIASVLAMGASHLALDEPTSELDPASALIVADVLKRINESGRTVIVSEQRLDLFAPLADRVIAISDGRVIADGNPREVLASEAVLRAGVLPPRVIQIYLEMSRAGLARGEPPINVEECAELLKSVQRGGSR